MALILRLAFQASKYIFWKQRNSRLHNFVSRPPSALIVEIKSILRCQLDPISRAQRVRPNGVSVLGSWLACFQP